MGKHAEDNKKRKQVHCGETAGKIRKSRENVNFSDSGIRIKGSMSSETHIHVVLLLWFISPVKTGLSKVRNLYHIFRCHQDILWFHVPMHDVFRVNVSYPRQHLTVEPFVQLVSFWSLSIFDDVRKCKWYFFSDYRYHISNCETVEIFENIRVVEASKRTDFSHQLQLGNVWK